WASRRVKNTTDFVVAGRKLPLVVAGSALFATWFGSETVMGAPAEFVDGGLLGVMEDPFGAALCLFLAGALIAKPLYRLKILTFNDFYRIRFGRATEMLSAFFMVPSYLGWIAAQMVAMAIVLNVLVGMSIFWGVMLTLVVVVAYTYIGGMWAVSVTDFVQTIMIIIGVIALAISVGSQAGGVEAVVAAQPEGFWNFFPERNLDAWVHYLAAWMTIGLGSIPQQDVFQRLMSGKDERTAARSGYLGGAMYLTIGFIPLFIGLCAKMLHPELLQDDPQKMLPLMTLKYGSLLIQILFFGALLSAILSTTSGAILAPATVVGENLVKPLFKKLTDKQLLLTMR
ncbi:MAG: sodium:solute symporter family protein, partial [Bacteroidota bacterium]